MGRTQRPGGDGRKVPVQYDWTVTQGSAAQTGSMQLLGHEAHPQHPDLKMLGEDAQHWVERWFHSGRYRKDGVGLRGDSWQYDVKGYKPRTVDAPEQLAFCKRVVDTLDSVLRPRIEQLMPGVTVHLSEVKLLVGSPVDIPNHSASGNPFLATEDQPLHTDIADMERGRRTIAGIIPCHDTVSTFLPTITMRQQAVLSHKSSRAAAAAGLEVEPLSEAEQSLSDSRCFKQFFKSVNVDGGSFNLFWGNTLHFGPACPLEHKGEAVKHRAVLYVLYSQVNETMQGEFQSFVCGEGKLAK